MFFPFEGAHLQQLERRLARRVVAGQAVDAAVQQPGRQSGRVLALAQRRRALEAGVCKRVGVGWGGGKGSVTAKRRRSVAHGARPPPAPRPPARPPTACLPGARPPPGS